VVNADVNANHYLCDAKKNLGSKTRLVSLLGGKCGVLACLQITVLACWQITRIRVIKTLCIGIEICCPMPSDLENTEGQCTVAAYFSRFDFPSVPNS
jgi:hypothetical protein